MSNATALKAARKVAAETFDAYLARTRSTATSSVPAAVKTAAAEAYRNAGGTGEVEVVGRGNATHPVCSVDVRRAKKCPTRPRRPHRGAGRGTDRHAAPTSGAAHLEPNLEEAEMQLRARQITGGRWVCDVCAGGRVIHTSDNYAIEWVACFAALGWVAENGD